MPPRAFGMLSWQNHPLLGVADLSYTEEGHRDLLASQGWRLNMRQLNFLLRKILSQIAADVKVRKMSLDFDNGIKLLQFFLEIRAKDC